MVLTAADLQPVLQTHPALVDRALGAVFPERNKPMNLDGLTKLTGPDAGLAQVLLAVLEAGDVVLQFEAFFGARGITLGGAAEPDDIGDVPTHLNAPDIPIPAINDFRSLAGLGEFAPRADAFRCRIKVGGKVEGSGAFISKRYVLTAAHVVETFTKAARRAEANGQDDAPLPVIKIRGSDEKDHRAYCVWHSPVHDNEREGRLPPVPDAEEHLDLALLRVGNSVGANYGYCDLSQGLESWDGSRLMTLIHYPDGAEQGLTFGHVLRETDRDLRLRHNIDTAGGSSGGFAFDHDFKFIGIHQGRWGTFRKLIPYSIFAQRTEILDAILKDNSRRYLWSLEDSLDGQIIIGRRKFFEGLARMMERPKGLLRGIWVRRIEENDTTGLGFSFQMLKAFLANRTQPSDPKTTHRCFQVPIDLKEKDLIKTLSEMTFGVAPSAPHAGVRAGETSKVAEARERAMRLATALQARAAENDETYWIFFETPPDGKLSDTVRAQFEHLVEWLVTHANLRVILAGFERISLKPLRFQHVDEADAARLPGLLVDPLHRFSDDDVVVTLAAMLSDLAGLDNLPPNELERMRAEIVRGVEGEHAGVYPFSALPEVIENLLDAVQKKLPE